MVLAIQRRPWALALALALLLHLLLFQYRFHWDANPHPMRVDLQQITPDQVEAIRQKWKDQPLGLLLDKNQPKAKEASPNARYMSDRNIRVEKEQRAQRTNILPKEGRPGPRGEKAQPRSESRALPRIGNLGVPFKLQEAPKIPQANPQLNPGDEAGDQYIDEKNIPTGSENLLNARESIYYSFYSRAYRAVGPLWYSRINTFFSNQRIPEGVFRAEVDVTFDREGWIRRVQFLKSSGLPEHDAIIEECWKKVERLPNPPAALIDQYGEVHIKMYFEIDNTANGFNFNLRRPQD